MIETTAITVVGLAGSYFLALGSFSILAPRQAETFLLGFASTPRLHYFELLVRALVGWAFLTAAPRLPATPIFSLFGWVLLGTSALLFLVPWEWHHRFAKMTVPMAIRHLFLIGLSSLIFGGLMLLAASQGFVT